MSVVAQKNQAQKVGDGFDKEKFRNFFEKKLIVREDSSIDKQAYIDRFMNYISQTPAVFYEALEKIILSGEWDCVEHLSSSEKGDSPFIAARKNLHTLHQSGTPIEADYMNTLLEHFKNGYVDVHDINLESAMNYYRQRMLDVQVGATLEQEFENDVVDMPVNCARNLGIPDSYNEKTIGDLSRSNVFDRVLAELPEGNDPEAVRATIAAMPAVCYETLAAIANGEKLPDYIFYPDYREEKDRGEAFADALFDLRAGNAKLTDPKTAEAKYQTARKAYQKELANEERDARDFGTRKWAQRKMKEELREIENADKRERALAKAAKKEAKQSQKNYMKNLKTEGRITEYNFLSKRFREYKKENALLDKANKEFRKLKLEYKKLEAKKGWNREGDKPIFTDRDDKNLSKVAKKLAIAAGKLAAVKETLNTNISARARSKEENALYSEHDDLRSKQIMSGDTSYMPLLTKEDTVKQIYSHYAAWENETAKNNTAQPNVQQQTNAQQPNMQKQEVQQQEVQQTNTQQPNVQKQEVQQQEVQQTNTKQQSEAAATKKNVDFGEVFKSSTVTANATLADSPVLKKDDEIAIKN